MCKKIIWLKGKLQNFVNSKEGQNDRENVQNLNREVEFL